MSATARAMRQWAAGALAITLCVSGAQAVRIDFDTAPGGAPIAHGTDIATTYASVGVTFASDGPGSCGGSVYAKTEPHPGFGSAPNVVSTCGPNSASDINGPVHGRIRADFNQAATRVCIDVLPDGPTLGAVLSVHDANDALIAQTASAPGVTGTICAAGAGIRRARFPGTGGTSVEYAIFDNLDVTFAADTPNYGGIWWNAPAASESGWGINFAHQGDTIFATWFTFGLDGKPLWLVVAATKQAPNVYSGALYTGTGPAFNAVPFDPAKVVPVAVGNATFTFNDGDSATFAYTVNGIAQTKSITREVFASPTPACVWGAQANLALATNFQDTWWASPAGSESGWGVNFAHQGDTIFVTWFTFGLDGKPLWLVAAATKTGPNAYAGNLYTGTGPAFNAVPFDPAQVVPSQVGTVALTFTDGNTATFAYSVNGVAQAKQITREVFGPPGTVCH